MTYFAGLLVIVLLIFLIYKIDRIRNIFILLNNFPFLKLHYLVYGIILTLFFPDNFMVLFERIKGSVLIFCLLWIGICYGCTLEIRTHQRFSFNTLIFHIIEPVAVFLCVALGGIMYKYIVFREMDLFVIMIIALSSSLTLFRKESPPKRESENTYYSIISDLLPLRNIFPVTALCIVSIVLNRTNGIVVFGHTYTGVFTLLFFHVILGISSGILYNILLAGARSTDSLLLVIIGVTAFTGGIVYMFSLSPIFVGMLAGAFLINSTLKRLQTLEAFAVSHESIEKIFMFFLGVLSVQLIQSVRLNLVVIFTGALGLFGFRSLLKYFGANLWVLFSHDYPRGSLLLWIGLTSQGLLAAGAALESWFNMLHSSFVFLFIIILLILNQIAMGIFVLRNR